jgi:hypothetical protein
MRLARLLLALTALTVSLTPVLAPASAAAQGPASSAPLPCTGTVNIVRVSEIKPGMMPTFLKAVTAQQAWYKQAGTTDEIGLMRIMVQNPDTKAFSVSETEAITTHTQPAVSRAATRDAGFDAFVALFS